MSGCQAQSLILFFAIMGDAMDAIQRAKAIAAKLNASMGFAGGAAGGGGTKRGRWGDDGKYGRYED